MTAVPDAAACATYTGREASDEALVDALAAEQAAQAAACRVDPYTVDLAQALKRRVRRNLEMRNLPLGVQQTGDGTSAISTYDPEVRRLERPYRRLVVG